jgi:hypothetical protein
MPTIGSTGVEFTKVAREWRCKYAMDADGTPAVSIIRNASFFLFRALT